MTMLRRIFGWVSPWLDQVAVAATRTLESFAPHRTAQLVEGEDGVLTVRTAGKDATARAEPVHVTNGEFIGPAQLKTSLAGARVELILHPRRFLFRSLELPRRATEFLDGIVRAQIDRLTPWSADEAVFGASAPDSLPDQRIAVTVAATAKDRLLPFVQAITRLGAQSVVISTAEPEASSDAAPIKVLEQKAAGALDRDRLRRILRNALVALLLLTGAAVTASIAVNNIVQDRQDGLLQRINKQRNALRAELKAGKNSKLAKLEQRKYKIAPTVIALESLSKILPDDTYVTELRISGDKMQIVGFTHEAPSLIRLIEQSNQFKHAVFFAPTTRAPSDPGDRFHIEATIKPFTPPT